MSLVEVGAIVRPHGIRGAVIVRALSDGSDLLLGVDEIVIDERGSRRSVEVVDAKPHGRQVLMSLEGVGDRNASEALVGATILVDRERYPEAGEDAWWAIDLIGLPVVSPSGDALGVVVGVETSPLQDWLVVERDTGRHLVPLTAPLAKVESKRVVVDAPEGLFEP